MFLLLAGSFLLVASIVGYLLIMSPMYKPLKAFLIALMIWWSVAMYAAPSHFMGWSKTVEELPYKCAVITFRIVEPFQEDEGGIYFWVLDRNQVKGSALDPREFLRKLSRTEPRHYRLDYSRELHKKLDSLKKRMSKSKNGMLIWGDTGDPSKDNIDGKQSESPKGFKIINPVDLLPEKE